MLLWQGIEKAEPKLDEVAHTCNLSTQEAEAADLYEFKAYILSSRTVRAT